MSVIQSEWWSYDMVGVDGAPSEGGARGSHRRTTPSSSPVAIIVSSIGRIREGAELREQDNILMSLRPMGSDVARLGV